MFDVINQPGDVSFLIDTLLAWNDDPANAFHQRIDAARIGIAGTSLGGMTTELAAYHPRVRDPRVKAAVSIAGPLQLFGRAFFADSTLPFMMVAGDIDAMVPYEQNARPVLERVNNAWLVSLAGASHTGFADHGVDVPLDGQPRQHRLFFVRGKTPQASDDTSFYDRLGTVEEGVLRNMEDQLCRMDPLPDAMSPLLQQRITMLAVRSFFETVFNPDARRAGALPRLPAGRPGARFSRRHRRALESSVVRAGHARDRMWVGIHADVCLPECCCRHSWRPTGVAGMARFPSTVIDGPCADPVKRILRAEFGGEEVARARHRVRVERDDRGVEIGDTRIAQARELRAQRGLVTHHRDITRRRGAFAIEHRAVGREHAVDRERFGDLPARPVGVGVSTIGMPATTRGAGRPAAAAARCSVGTMCCASVRGPVIQVMVPSASSPAIPSITGPSAATSTGMAAAPGTARRMFTL